ncbi:MAG: tRNA (guanosine(46)-N7)-methyltransferase TrmB [Chthoniobacterales bacterium]
MPRNSPLSPAAQAAELFLPADSSPLDFAAIFGRIAPVEVDLGCGDGSVLAALAAENPGRTYLGIEQLRGRAASACRKIAQRRLSNARLLRADIDLVVRAFLQPGSVTRFHLLFPDPWPKRRHAVRRIASSSWLCYIAAALAPGGSFRLVTDDSAYFAQAGHALAAVPELRLSAEAGDEELPPSTFEQRFRAAGIPIHHMIAVRR